MEPWALGSKGFSVLCHLPGHDHEPRRMSHETWTIDQYQLMDRVWYVAQLDAKAKSPGPKIALVHTPPKLEAELQEVEWGSDRFDVCGVWGTHTNRMDCGSNWMVMVNIRNHSASLLVYCICDRMWCFFDVRCFHRHSKPFLGNIDGCVLQQKRSHSWDIGGLVEWRFCGTSRTCKLNGK